jgi:hypothetical protein
MPQVEVFIARILLGAWVTGDPKQAYGYGSARGDGPILRGRCVARRKPGWEL